MKKFIDKLKKAFGAEEDEQPVPVDNSVYAEKPTDVPEPVKTKPPPSFALPPAAEKREEIIRFIINSLRVYVNERNTGIKGLRLYVLCQSKEEETLANVALYGDIEDKFKREELQRKLSDNYISPDNNWSFEFQLLKDQLPACNHQQGSLGLDVIKRGQTMGNYTLASITCVTGQTELEEYILDPNKKQKYCIGRGKNPGLSSGAMHTNDIYFLGKEEPAFDAVKGAANQFVSRNHVIIVFNTQQKKYFVAADKGGTPDSGNKTKLFTADGKMTRLDIAGAMHELNDGDHLQLGSGAKLLFKQV